MFLSELLLASSRLPGFKTWHHFLHGTHEKLKTTKEVFDISFRSPYCLADSHDKDGRIIDALSGLGYGYVGVDCYGPRLHKLIENIHKSDPLSRTAANLRIRKGESEQDSVIRPYSLMYDFATLFILHIPDSAPKTAFSGDFTDFYPLIDEILNLRLCFEAYRPVLLSIPSGADQSERRSLIDYARLNGIDGLVTEGAAQVKADFEYTGGRLPIIGRGRIQESADLLAAGASLVECTQPSFLGKYLNKL